MLGKKRQLKKISKTEPSFLVKLFNILNESQYKSYIRWGPDGQSVVISDSNGLTKKVLPKFYNHNNYASFVRQLNMYNFHKVRSNQKNGEEKYIHNEFKKSKTLKEIQSIHRKMRKDKKKYTPNKTKNKSDKKLDENINNNSNDLEDNFALGDVDQLDEDTKFSNFENLLKNGELSSFSNEKIIAFLFEKLKESMENQKQVEAEINELIKQNNNLLQQLQICNNKLISQNDFCKKMKGLVIFFVTLIMKKRQNFKICRVDLNGGKVDSNNNKNKKSLVDFVFKYLNYQKNKSENSSNNSINNSENETPIIQKGENFSLNQNNLFKSLINNTFEELYKENDFPMANINRNPSLDLDLKNAKSNSSLNLFNNSLFQLPKK